MKLLYQRDKFYAPRHLPINWLTNNFMDLVVKITHMTIIQKKLKSKL